MDEPAATAPTSPLVSVIVPSFNRQPHLLQTARDLLAQDYPRLEIVVVDQNRGGWSEWRDAYDEVRRDPRVDWIESEPVGVVPIRNMAVERSRGELLLFVDDDVRIFDRSFVRHHVERYRDESVVAVCGRELTPQHHRAGWHEHPLEEEGAKVSPVDGEALLEDVLDFSRASEAPREIPVFSTCNGSIRRSAFLAVGGFDEHFRGPSYGDDADLALRLAGQGFRIVYDPRPWLVHLRAPAGGLRFRDPANRFGEAEKALSGLIVALRHGRGRSFWRLLYGWGIRRTFLLRQNVRRPWRQPGIALGFARAWLEARRAVAEGPVSRFGQGGSVPGPPSG